MLLPLLLALGTQVPDTTHLVIVATADVHGQVTAWDYANQRPYPGGLARAATVLDSLRRQYPGQVLLVDAGDVLQGGAFSAYFAREARRDPHPALDAMAAMGYDAATPGGRDFDWGVPFLQRSMAGVSFPFVSANIHALPGDTLMRPPFTVVQRSGIRVAVTGLTSAGVMTWHREALRDRARVNPPGPAGQRALRQLAGQADFTVLLFHAGSGPEVPSNRPASGPGELPAVLAGPARPDLVILGNSADAAPEPVIAGVPVIRPPALARGLAVVHLTLRRESTRWVTTRVRSETVLLDRVDPAVTITRRLAGADDAVRRWLAGVVGSTSAPMPATTARAEPSAIVQYLNEVLRRRAGTDLAATPVFDPAAGLPHGDLTLAQVMALYPEEHTLVGIRITGAQLKEYLETSARYYRLDERGRASINDSMPGSAFDIVSGAEYALDLRLPPGDRVRALQVRGRPVAPEDQFTLATTSYRAAGGDGYGGVSQAPVVYSRGEYIRDLVLEDLKTRGLLRVEDFGTRNWRLVPEEAADAARRLFLPAVETARRTTPRDTTVLRIFWTNDLHGALEPRVLGEGTGARRIGGLATIKRLMDSLGAQCGCADLRLDGGDQMQGTLASNLAYGRAMIAAMNRLGLDAAVIGNHEFDWSLDTLQRRMAESRYPWVAANIVDSATGTRPPWAVPFRVLEAGKLRVGVLGYVTPLSPSIVRGETLAGIRFLGPEGLDAPLAELRRLDPDLVILLAHEGGGCDSSACQGPILDLARRFDSTRVDLILSGHWHRVMETRVNGIPLLQAGSSGSAVGMADVIQTVVGGREIRTRILVPDADQVGQDSAMAALVAQARRQTDSLAGIAVATLKVPIGRGDALGNLVADAFRNALRTEIGMMNRGGLRAGLPAGPVGYAQVYEVEPFGNQLVRVTLTGLQLRQLLEQALSQDRPGVFLSGLRVVYDPRRPAGRRIRELRLLNDRRVEDRARYTLATNDYLAEGKDGLTVLAGLPSQPSGVQALDAIVGYLRRLPQPVSPPEDERFRTGR